MSFRPGQRSTMLPPTVSNFGKGSSCRKDPSLVLRICSTGVIPRRYDATNDPPCTVLRRLNTPNYVPCCYSSEQLRCILFSQNAIYTHDRAGFQHTSEYCQGILHNDCHTFPLSDLTGKLNLVCRPGAARRPAGYYRHQPARVLATDPDSASLLCLCEQSCHHS